MMYIYAYIYVNTVYVYICEAQQNWTLNNYNNWIYQYIPIQSKTDYVVPLTPYFWAIAIEIY